MTKTNSLSMREAKKYGGAPPDDQKVEVDCWGLGVYQVFLLWRWKILIKLSRTREPTLFCHLQVYHFVCNGGAGLYARCLMNAAGGSGDCTRVRLNAMSLLWKERDANLIISGSPLSVRNKFQNYDRISAQCFS